MASTFKQLKNHTASKFLSGIVLVSAGVNHITNPASSLMSKIFGSFTAVTGGLETVIMLIGIFVAILGLMDFQDFLKKLGIL